MAIVPLFWGGRRRGVLAGDNKVRLCMVRELVTERWEEGWAREEEGGKCRHRHE